MKAGLLTPIFNRDGGGKFQIPADGWYHLVPKGEFPIHIDIGGKEEKLIQVLDDKALTSFVNRFAAQATQGNFPGILIDQEHFSYDKTKSSEAYGWIKQIENRVDGIWGKIDWTDVGDSAVKSGRYRFVSPVWLPTQVEKISNRKIRPLQLDTAALTNTPNLKGMVPLSNRDALSFADNPETKNKGTKMKSVAAKLGLSAEASEEAILGAVEAIMNRATTAEGALTPMKTRAETAEGKLTTLEGQLVETTLDKYSNRFLKEKREGWKTAILANRETTVALLEGLPIIGAAKPANAYLNRNTAKTPEKEATQGETVEVTTQFLDSKVRAIMNRDGIKDFSTAYGKLMSEEPALFAAPAKE